MLRKDKLSLLIVKLSVFIAFHFFVRHPPSATKSPNAEVRGMSDQFLS